MPERFTYEYAIVRVVPRVSRDEFVNAGVIVFAKQRKLLQAKTIFDPARLRALWPSLNVEEVSRHLNAVERVCTGDADAGPIALMSQSERFHWLTAPRSTVIQVSPVRTGLADDLDGLLHHLSRELVETAGAEDVLPV